MRQQNGAALPSGRCAICSYWCALLAARYSLKHAMEVFPAEYRELLAELLHEPTIERETEFAATIVDELTRRGRIWHLIHVTVRLVRNLASSELIIGGDCWDRGSRGDRVVDYLRVFRSLRRPRLHAGARTRPHVSGQASSL